MEGPPLTSTELLVLCMAAGPRSTKMKRGNRLFAGRGEDLIGIQEPEAGGADSQFNGSSEKEEIRCARYSA